MPPCNTCADEARCDRLGLCQDFGFAPASHEVVANLEDIHGQVCGEQPGAANFDSVREVLDAAPVPTDNRKVWPEDFPAPAPVAAIKPLDMVLHCPMCHMQHIDQPVQPTRQHAERGCGSCGGTGQTCDYPTCLKLWANPPHRSHLCRKDEGGCGTIWRPADVPTNGVAAITTRGKADTWPATGAGA